MLSQTAVEHEALLLAVLAQEPEALAPARRGSAGALRPDDGNLARVQRGRGRRSPAAVGAPGPDQPGQAEDLAARRLKARGL